MASDLSHEKKNKVPDNINNSQAQLQRLSSADGNLVRRSQTLIEDSSIRVEDQNIPGDNSNPAECQLSNGGTPFVKEGASPSIGSTITVESQRHSPSLTTSNTTDLLNDISGSTIGSEAGTLGTLSDSGVLTDGQMSPLYNSNEKGIQLINSSTMTRYVQMPFKSPGMLEHQLSEKKSSLSTKPFPTKPHIFVNVDSSSQDIIKDFSSTAEISTDDGFLTEQGKWTTEDLHSVNSSLKNVTLDQNGMSSNGFSSATKTQPQANNTYGESIASISDYPDLTIDSSRTEYASYVVIPLKTSKVSDSPKSVKGKSTPLGRYRSMNVGLVQDEIHTSRHASISLGKSNPSGSVHRSSSIVNSSSLEDEPQTKSNPSSSPSPSLDSSQTSSMDHDILRRGNRTQAMRRSPNGSTDRDSMDWSVCCSTHHSPINSSLNLVDHEAVSFSHHHHSVIKSIERDKLVKGSRHSTTKKFHLAYQESTHKGSDRQMGKRLSGSNGTWMTNSETADNASNVISVQTQTSFSDTVNATKHQNTQ